MKIEHITLLNAFDATLRGYFTTSDSAKDVCVLMLHGFTGNKTETGGIFRTFSRLLVDNNISSLRLDYMGNGESDKEFCDFDWNTLKSDVLVMLEYVIDTLQFKKVIVLGFSMGGALALELAKTKADAILGLLLWSPAVNIKEIIERIFHSSPKLSNGNIDYLGWEIKRDFLETLHDYAFSKDIKNVNMPCMVIHGTKDLPVPYVNGESVAKNLEKCELILVKDATHGYNQAEDKAELFEKSLKFIKKICYNMDVEWGG